MIFLAYIHEWSHTTCELCESLFGSLRSKSLENLFKNLSKENFKTVIF